MKTPVLRISNTPTPSYADMIQRYAKRLLSPFIGLVQVVEIANARALSLDGKNWAIQCAPGEASGVPPQTAASDPGPHFALVATLEAGILRKRVLHPFLEADAVDSAVDVLCDAVRPARLPFATTDRYEYWLLDPADDTPLALLRSCVQDGDMARMPPDPAWTAIPSAQLEVSDPTRTQTYYVPPVNYRLQKLIGGRAGSKPRAAWFDRSESSAAPFPPCLIREDWDTEEKQLLCDRYINRLAPRLLMLQDLASPVRCRLERAAREHVFDVERFHPLYPEVVDNKLITAARVEAQFRRTAAAAA